MALIRKTDPVALDRSIDLFQDEMFTTLGFGDWESMHRVYQNPDKERLGLIPEAFRENGEYREVFYNDNFNITSFFLVSSERPPQGDGSVLVDVAWIFAADTKKLYPLIERGDENLNNAIHFASMDYSLYDTFKFNGFETTINNVYREFIKDQIALDNMSNQYVVRFNYKVSYTPECCDNC